MDSLIFISPVVNKFLTIPSNLTPINYIKSIYQQKTIESVKFQWVLFAQLAEIFDTYIGKARPDIPLSPILKLLGMVFDFLPGNASMSMSLIVLGIVVTGSISVRRCFQCVILKLSSKKLKSFYYLLSHGKMHPSVWSRRSAGAFLHSRRARCYAADTPRRRRHHGGEGGSAFRIPQKDL